MGVPTGKMFHREDHLIAGWARIGLQGVQHGQDK
jgi:hypothetical protein